MTRDRSAHVARSAALLLLPAVLVAGCAGGGGGAGVAAGTSPNAAATATGRSQSAQSAPARQAGYDAGYFGLPGRATNTYLPLRPGTQWVREGATDVGHRRVPHRVISTVTGVSKEIDGVRTIAVLDQDVDAGQITQESLDYFAEDNDGSVWYLGSYTEAYEGGSFVAVRDAWLAGVKGGEPGILMPADPRTGTPPFSIARPPGEDGDVAQVVRSGQRTCVPFKCFTDVLVVREGKASAPDNEFKYYAPGVGQVLNTPRSASQHRDLEKLVNLTMLSAQGLDEANAEALKLDKNASSQVPRVFGGSAPAAAL